MIEAAVEPSPSRHAAPSRIAAAFAATRAANRAALIPFVTAGYPNLEMSESLVMALVAGGADLIEIGVPFSDPLADGATVQATSQRALEQGTTLADCLALSRRVRDRGVTIPLLLMGYTNPFYQYGLGRLATDAADAGIDGFIIPDLPADESAEFADPIRASGRDLIVMVAPTSTDERIRQNVTNASGFVYCVALTGVTGARTELSTGLDAYIQRIRRQTDLPLAIGFGISRPEHVRQASAIADGVVVASALINHIDTLPPAEQAAGAAQFVRTLADATTRVRPDVTARRADEE